VLLQRQLPQPQLLLDRSKVLLRSALMPQQLHCCCCCYCCCCCCCCCDNHWLSRTQQGLQLAASHLAAAPAGCAPAADC
jgi:hypothetical protein